MPTNGHGYRNGHGYPDSAGSAYDHAPEYSTKQALINSYEADEERVYNKLSRQLSALLDQAPSSSSTNGTAADGIIHNPSPSTSASSVFHGNGFGLNGSNGQGHDSSHPTGAPWSTNPYQPAMDVLLDNLRRENAELRIRVVDVERDYVRVTRLNDSYREELIELRMRLGLPIDNLIGLSPSPSSHPPPSSQSHHPPRIPASSVAPRAHPFVAPTFSIPINRPSSTSSVRHVSTVSSSSTPSHASSSHPSTSSSSPPSPFLDPGTSVMTNLTSPAASAQPQALQLPARNFGLTYPSVPPPSLSSSFGSPVATYRDRSESMSPVEPLSRRNSISVNYAGGRIGGSVERGGRVAEVGSLVRSRAGSTTSYTRDRDRNAATEGDEIFIVEE